MKPTDPQEPIDAELFRRIYNKCIEWLSRREHSQLELTQKLNLFIADESAGKLPAALLEKVLERLIELGYQSDSRFAEAYCRSRLRKGFGAQRIVIELVQRGIETHLAEQAIANNCKDEFDSDRLIYKAWSKKFRQLPLDLQERAKHQRFLQYRGFSSQEISHLFDQLASEHH